MKPARTAMRHRAVVLRNVETGRSRYNTPLAPDFAPLADLLPCRLWSSSERTIDQTTEGPNINVVVEGLRMMIPLDADLTTADRIGAVTDRRGRSIEAHVKKIDADHVIPGSHREIAITVITGNV